MTRARLAGLLGGLSCVSCLPRGSATPDTDPPMIPDDENPVLVSLARDCDVQAGQWVIDAETEHWSGGMLAWWTVDGSVVEGQVVGVVESDPNGAWDRMHQVLPIVSDWRLQVNGVNTRFTCAEPVNTLFWVQNPLGARIQCRVLGPDPAVFDGIPGIPACP
ncbi:MAG: hypothetical protein H6737_00715 [Alphaproteobacteria bacterium]|nr:hypothetical protein [Alphaproteobacteria bacterium]